MTIKWPPKKAFEYDAKNPEKENGIVISAQPRGKILKRKEQKKQEKADNIFTNEKVIKYEL